MVFFACDQTDFSPDEGTRPSLTQIEARFLRLMLDLNLGDRQADAISR